jgi:predicted ArsR family transcriptional regulator
MTDEPVGDDADLSDLVALLDDEHVRSILVETSAEPLSAAELAERCGVSTSAVYRRTDRLVDADLLRERTRPRSDGHHDTVYAAVMERFELTVRDGELDWSVDRTETDVADELTRLWGKF